MSFNHGEASANAGCKITSFDMLSRHNNSSLAMANKQINEQTSLNNTVRVNLITL